MKKCPSCLNPMRAGGRALYRPGGRGAPTFGVVCRECLRLSIRVVLLTLERSPALRLPKVKRTGILVGNLLPELLDEAGIK